MKTDDITAIISLIIAIIALLYSVLSNTKKYELTYQHYDNILSWYEKVIEILMALRINSLTTNEKELYLSKLSYLIEYGRFLFPNIDKKDGYGQDKPLAYRGYRNVILDFLVCSYRLFQKTDSQNYIQHAKVLEKLFTSYVFKYLNPTKQNKKIAINTFFKNREELSIKDFLSESPESIYLKYYID